MPSFEDTSSFSEFLVPFFGGQLEGTKDSVVFL